MTNAKAISETDLLSSGKRRKHLFISKDNLQELQSAIDREPLESFWEIFLADTKSRISSKIEEFPKEDPNTPVGVVSYYSVFRSCLRDLTNFSFAFLLTENNDFLKIARERISTVLSWKTWVHPAHYPKTIDLVTSEITRTLAIASEWLGKNLLDADKKAICEAVQSRVIGQYITGMFDESGWWARECTTNWCAVVNGGIGSALLYFLEDNKILCDILNEILSRLAIYLKGFDPDGGWIEGVQYWAYGITWYLYFADALSNATQGRINAVNIPQMKNAITFPVHLYLPPDKIVNFCDALPNPDINLALPLLKLDGEFKESPSGWLAERIISISKGMPSPYFFIWRQSVKDENKKVSQPTAKIFRKLEWGILRSSWTDDAVILAVKGGYADPYEHTHLDAGTFILNAFGSSLIADLGRGEYSREYFSPKRWQNTHANTYGHNTYIIDGEMQLEGKIHRGMITDFKKIGTHQYIRMDISSCYSASKAKSIIRHFTLVKDFGCVVLDEIDSVEGVEIESRIHFAGSGQITDGNSCIITNGNIACSIKSEYEVPVQILLRKHSEYDVISNEKGFFAEIFKAPKNRIFIARYMHPYELKTKRPETSLLLKRTQKIATLRITLANGSKTLLWINKNGKNLLDSIS